MSEIPVIDLTPARVAPSSSSARDARLRVADEIDRACSTIGFFGLTGHGVPETAIADLRAAAHGFFALPLADKLAARHPVPGTNRGYHPVGGEALVSSLATAGAEAAPPPDLKEFFHVGPVDVTSDPYYTGALGRQHFLPNIWPALPADFERAATIYYRTMSGLVLELMRLTALALELPEKFFDPKVDRSIGTMRLNYYPAQHATPRPGQLRAGAHTDYGGFTILSGEDVPGGLQVRNRDGDWIDVRTEPSTFVVNIGDLLMRWTNDRWLSTLHRVVNPDTVGQGSPARLSIAFFSHPNYDALIECIAPGVAAKHPPVLSGEYRDLQYAKIGLATARTSRPDVMPQK